MRILPLKHYIRTVEGLVDNFVEREKLYPFYASLKVTSHCHFGCGFCNMKDNLTPDLPTEEIMEIMDNLSRSPVLMTSFEGGEPLLREDISELLYYARHQCEFYLLFTTSERKLLEYPMEKYAKYIDFLHISMDEEHNNLEMFDQLPKIVKLPTQISVQTVVTKETVEALEDKVSKCTENGANIVIIPAAPMENAKIQSFPDIDILENEVKRLKKKYKGTIHTPNGYFKSFRKQECSPTSIVIAPDGFLYYPCHLRNEKPIDMRKTELTEWLETEEAAGYRKEMKECDKNCGWYQYYSTDHYLKPSSALASLWPMLFQKRKR